MVSLGRRLSLSNLTGERDRVRLVLVAPGGCRFSLLRDRTLHRCTTTPVIRKKPTGRTGKRIEEARATFGTIDPDAPEFMGPSNTPWITPRAQQGQSQQQITGSATPQLGGAEARLASTELSGQVIAHLLGCKFLAPCRMATILICMSLQYIRLCRNPGFRFTREAGYRCSSSKQVNVWRLSRHKSRLVPVI